MPALRIALALLAVLALALVSAAPPAVADDRAVSDAWDSQDRQFEELSRSVRREARRWQSRRYTRDGKYLRLMTRGETLSRRVVAALQAAQPSTPTGGQARDLAIRSTAHLADFFVNERRWIRAMRPGGSSRARRLARESKRLFDLSASEADQARPLFRSLGLD